LSTPEQGFFFFAEACAVAVFVWHLCGLTTGGLSRAPKKTNIIKPQNKLTNEPPGN